MGPLAPKPTRRRNRKRKRRAASSDSSSSDDDSSSDESVQSKTQTQAPPIKESEFDVTSSSESASSDSDSQSDDDDPGTTTANKYMQADNPRVPREKGVSRSSPSPPLPSAEIPSFLPSSPHADDMARDQAMKEKFRKFWMSSIAEGFKDDLEEIRKEPSLGPSRLALLIDSLAAGADIFTTSVSGGGSEMNEVDVVMGE